MIEISYNLTLPLTLNLDWSCDNVLTAYYKIYRADNIEDFTLIATTTDAYYADLSIYKKRVSEELNIKIEAYSATNVLLEECVKEITSTTLKNSLKYRRWFETNYLKSLNAAGHEIAYLKKKSSGTTCPACVHYATDESTNPRCSVCYGTGYVGGYYSPIIFKGLFGPFKIYANERGVENHFETESGTFIGIPGPKLNRSDILIDLGSLDRYQIEGSNTSYFNYDSANLGTIFYNVVRLSHQDPAYLVPIQQLVPTISKAEYDSTTGYLHFTGIKLRPRFGSIHTAFYYDDESNNRIEQMYYSDSLKSIKDTEIVFNIGTSYTGDYEYKYVTVDNNKRFAGTIYTIPRIDDTEYTSETGLFSITGFKLSPRSGHVTLTISYVDGIGDTITDTYNEDDLTLDSDLELIFDIGTTYTEAYTYNFSLSLNDKTLTGTL